MTKLDHFLSISSLLLTAVVGVTLGACDPKMIGAESESETDGDVMCKDGEVKPSEDGCNTCTCSDGVWACTELACEEPKVCEEGATKPSEDGCNSCTCYQGDWVCTQTACDLSTTGTDTGATSTSTTGTDTGATSTSTTGTDSDATSTSTTGTDTGGASCGNGVVEPGEACDDGNLVDDDGCANDCGLGGGACLPNDPLEINGATIEGDTLKVEVSYGGGCETHVIDMCWDGIFAESFPVQTWIALSHDGNDDFCDAWITEVRSIDLGGMKSAYQEGYQAQNGTIVIQIQGWAQGVEYTF